MKFHFPSVIGNNEPAIWKRAGGSQAIPISGLRDSPTICMVKESNLSEI
jgi:hypothetical protein